MKTRGWKIDSGRCTARSVLECGGKRSATALSDAGELTNRSQPSSARKCRRRCALPAQSKTWRSIAILFLLSTLNFQLATALAQSYSIDWFTVDGGGGTSTGGVYAVTGTIGQPDASAAMTGGNYSLTGGFWSLYAVQTPGAPVLTIAYVGNQAIVSWDASTSGWTLQTNLSLATPTWGNYLGSVVNNRATNSPTKGNLFFRLAK